jgi:hypothetical protein
LGLYSSAASKQAYRRAIAEWLANKEKPKDADKEPVSVAKLMIAYWKFDSAYHIWDKDTDRGDAHCLKSALRIVRLLSANTSAEDFGPLALKCCRSAMLEKDWSRTYTIAQIDRIGRMFRWGAEEQLVPYCDRRVHLFVKRRARRSCTLSATKAQGSTRLCSRT